MPRLAFWGGGNWKNLGVKVEKNALFRVKCIKIFTYGVSDIDLNIIVFQQLPARLITSLLTKVKTQLEIGAVELLIMINRTGSVKLMLTLFIFIRKDKKWWLCLSCRHNVWWCSMLASSESLMFTGSFIKYFLQQASDGRCVRVLAWVCVRNSCGCVYVSLSLILGSLLMITF